MRRLLFPVVLIVSWSVCLPVALLHDLRDQWR